MKVLARVRIGPAPRMTGRGDRRACVAEVRAVGRQHLVLVRMDPRHADRVLHRISAAIGEENLRHIRPSEFNDALSSFTPLVIRMLRSDRRQLPGLLLDRDNHLRVLVTDIHAAVYKLRKHVEQIDDTAEEDEYIGDDFENLYKGEISKSGVPILPSKRARKIPEKIQVSKEDLAELSPSAKPDVNVEAPSDAEENDEVSLDQVSEAEEQVSDNVSDEENNS